MTRATLVCIALLCVVAPLEAGWEVSLLAGWTAPTFEESFVFSPDIDLPSIPGGAIRQEGEFVLTGRGSFAFGGSVAYFFNEHVAIEGRVDTVDFEVDVTAPRFAAEIELPPPLPPAAAVLDLGDGIVDIERLYPLSLNLKARTGGAVRFVGSGGLSYLPRVKFNAALPVGLGLAAPGLPPVELASLLLQAGAITDESNSKWGFNAGAGVEIQVAPSVAIVGDVRFHMFESQTFVWQTTGDATSPIEEILIAELQKLPPIEIELIYFQATGGVAFRF